ncbi:hypothetical protein Tco_0756021 [Tanacetum coccineum]
MADPAIKLRREKEVSNRDEIVSRLCKDRCVWTSDGCKRLGEVDIHFRKGYGNLIDMGKLVSGSDMKWYEVDVGYMDHPVLKVSPDGEMKLRKFLEKLGVTDFVKIVQKVYEKRENVPTMTGGDTPSPTDKIILFSIPNKVPIKLDLEKHNYNPWSSFSLIHLGSLGLKAHVESDSASTNPGWCQLDDLIKMWILSSLCDSLQEQVVTTPGNAKQL